MSTPPRGNNKPVRRDHSHGKVMFRSRSAGKEEKLELVKSVDGSYLLIRTTMDGNAMTIRVYYSWRKEMAEYILAHSIALLEFTCGAKP